MQNFIKELTRLCLIWVFAFSSAFTVLAATQANTDESRGVVYRLYKEFGWVAYFSSNKDSESHLGGSILQQPRPVLSQYFDDELTELMMKEEACETTNVGELCNLEFDLLFGSQDTAATDLTITQKGASRTLVSYTYPSDQSKMQIEYQLRKVGAGWKISDVVYIREKRTSLKALLSKR